MNVFEFEITIQSKSGDSSWPIVVRCKQPDGLTIHSKETLELSQDDFNELTQQQENERKYGTLLGKALFRGAVYDTFVRALSKSSQDCRLRILLSIEAADNDEVKTLHWERLCAPIDADEDWDLLARDQRVPFSLYIPTIIDRCFPPIGRRDLRALVLVASPSNIGKFQLAPFDVEDVLSGVKEALGDIPYEILANDVAGAIGPPTLKELSKQLTNSKKPYTLLHFVAHGKLLDDGDTVLYWAEADNQVESVTGEQLVKELKNIGNHQRSLPHFAFLCTCESADPRAEAGLGGLGQRLVRHLGMPAVVAMTRKVSVETGLALGQSFYRRLRESGEVDTALQEATAGLGKRHDIAVPALFSRLGGRPLFSDRLDDRDLTDEEIEYGIEKLSKLLAERAPNASVLNESFKTQVEILNDTQGAESRIAREQRQKAILEIDNLCDQVLEISFDALAALGKEPPQYKAECPFPGLSSFAEEQYHKFFFGRDELIRDLQKELAKDNFLAVIGASGSGKSSVVLAGLIPKLKEQEPSLQSVRITPSNEPLKQLEILLKVSEQHSVLVVDQFEELFTLCEDKDNRQKFIGKLLHLAERRKVVITMRADFLGECTFYPELRKRIETRQKLVGPMEPAELITAMKMQADRGGLRFETGLSLLVLNDVQGEPGAMPLLQYALQELWKRRCGRWLCNKEYEAIGKVQKAIAKTADAFYTSLPAKQQEQIQNIFLRLTRLDKNAIQVEKRRDTRQRVELEDLVPSGSNMAETRMLVQQLAGEGVRLVVTSWNQTTGKEEVEVAHEALIRYWPRLQEWLSQNRTDLQLRENIRQAAEEWQPHQKQPGQHTYLIHQGGRLEDAEVLWKHPKFVHLNQLEEEYVLACVQLRDRIRKQEEQRKQRLLMATASAAFVLGGFAIFAGSKWREAEMERIQALLQSAETGLVTHQAIDARIGSLRAGTQLKQSFWQKLWPDAQLKDQVLGKLTSTVYAGQEVNRLQTNLSSVETMAFTSEGRLVIADNQGTISLEDAKTQKWENIPMDNSLKKTEEKSDSLYYPHVQLSPDGQKLALIGYPAGKIYLSDTKTKKQEELPGSEAKGFSEPRFSADSQLLSASNAEEGFAYLWNTKTKRLPNKFKFPPNDESNKSGYQNAQFSPNGRFWVITRNDNTVDVLDSKTKELYTLPQKASSVQISPDSQILAVKGENSNTFLLWNTENREWSAEINSSGNTEFDSVKFSPDSQILVFREVNGTIWLRDTKGQTLDKLQGQDSLSGMAFSRDRQLLVTSDDRTVRMWDISGQPLKVIRTEGSLIGELEFSPDSQRLAGQTFTDEQSAARLWDDAQGKDLPLPEGLQGKVKGVAFSPDNPPDDQILIATTTNTNDGIISLWNNKGKKHSLKLQGDQGTVQQVVFSPNGRYLAVRSTDTNDEDRTVSVWLGDTQDKQLVKLQGDREEISKIKTIEAISPDGQQLTVRSTNTNDNSPPIVWSADTKGQQLVKASDKVYRMAFSGDGQFLVAVVNEGDGIIQVWDTKGRQLKHNFPNKGRISSVAISRDGQLIATGGFDSTVRLWSITGQELAKFQGHSGVVYSVAFSPDGEKLASSGGDGTVRLYKIRQELDELLAMNCDRVRGYLKDSRADISERDPQLCDGISTASSSPKK
ncbi:CHAT domain-containing protein [Trichocoleus sp. ST-U3]